MSFIVKKMKDFEIWFKFVFYEKNREKLMNNIFYIFCKNVIASFFAGIIQRLSYFKNSYNFGKN